MKLTIGLFSDTFSPLTDEAAQAACDCAGHIQDELGECFVVTPKAPGYKDRTPYEVIRTMSLPLPARWDRRLPLAFEKGLMRSLANKSPDLLHVHSPFTMMRMARWLRELTLAPIVLSIHERYTELISCLASWGPMQSRLRKMVLQNLRSADEIWVDSRALAADIRALGYTGGFVRREHGCELSDKRVTNEWRAVVDKLHMLKDDTLLFLCVGRLFREDKLLLRTMGRLRDNGLPFKLVVIGDGPAKNAWEDQILEYKLGGHVQIIPRPPEKDVMRAYYDRASLLLCPWADVTTALTEASALKTPSFLLCGDDVMDDFRPGVNGFVGTSDPMLAAEEIRALISDPSRLKSAGQYAHDTFYIPGSIAARANWERYEMVCRLHRERQQEDQQYKEFTAAKKG